MRAPLALRSREGRDYTDGCMLQTALRNIATRLRIESIRSTSEAGSGHPTSCCSAADIIAALLLAAMRYDPTDPQPPGAARLVPSTDHRAPVCVAGWDR